jgi:hypothetical protein
MVPRVADALASAVAGDILKHLRVPRRERVDLLEDRR